MNATYSRGYHEKGATSLSAAAIVRLAWAGVNGRRTGHRSHSTSSARPHAMPANMTADIAGPSSRRPVLESILRSGLPLRLMKVSSGNAIAKTMSATTSLILSASRSPFEQR